MIDKQRFNGSWCDKKPPNKGLHAYKSLKLAEDTWTDADVVCGIEAVVIPMTTLQMDVIYTQEFVNRAVIDRRCRVTVYS